MQPRKKAVSKSQFRYFISALKRIEAGGKSPIKDMTADDLRYALEGVDFDSLPERAASKFKKPRKATKPQQLPAAVVVPQTLLQAQTPTPEPLPAGVLSFEDFLSRHPGQVSTA